MKYEIRLTLYLILLFIGLSTFLSAQIKATTDSGMEVRLFEDGTWEMANAQSKMTTMTTKCPTSLNINNQKIGQIAINIAKIPEEQVTIVTVKTAFKGIKTYGNSEITVLFTNGKKVKLKDDSQYEKNEKFTLYFGSIYEKEEILRMFETKEVRSIHLQSPMKSIKHTLTSTESTKLFEMFNCP